MATTEANNILQANASSTIEPVRSLANFPPSLWGDRFLSFSLDDSQLESYAKAMEQPKEEVRRFILNPATDSNKKLSLIYSVYRLGLAYVFSKDIDGELDKLFNQHNSQSYHDADLYTISIHFQVFRLFGYRFSCDVFSKFKDCNLGEFKDDITQDVRGMISFYESAHLSIRGESILDDAFVFTETKLKTMEKTLQGSLEQQVKHVLERPFIRGHPMVEARRYLLDFQEEASKYESLHMLAKVHFNYLQLLQKEELRIVSKWWKDLDLQVKLPYVRDRVPEIYIWASALFLDPYYSQARIITTKIILFLLVLDDTYDAYATIEELRVITHAINRWDMSAMLQIPDYFKPFYELMLNEYAEFNKQLPPHDTKNAIIEASKKLYLQNLAMGYHQEAEWRHSGEMPSYEEYMKVGLVTSTHDVICKSALIGMGKIVTQEAVSWYESYPKIIRDVQLVGRLTDDVVSVEFERERGPIVSSVDTYKKSFEVSEDIALEALKNIIENAWKDINDACLKPTEIPMDLLSTVVDIARMTDVAYRYNDGLTFPERSFKKYITLLLFDRVVI
ncbi:hypothetical protein R6Q59_020218 [Mikania micrantha]